MNETNEFMTDLETMITYIVTCRNELDDFIEQILCGDLEPAGGVPLHVWLGCSEDEAEEVATTKFRADPAIFALAFGTDHVYPVAVRMSVTLTELVADGANDKRINAL